ncbi:lysophospholipid acyltransferase family protein [Suttonella ornithocola]|uniref:1-acyl-sn-glycerol-3-phosphate acyltransferase n=1 Tax=Suttonella ornithocola TaxID=279832 RepID=A0A380MLG4_9GAMM|nr:lysophospholipid acyltransferase family protein [Suttonella ornithocola]SUO93088.1 1-acyl-sn-glycerol-3-phosphate acyltransferase [Suttonella ornithocola]
MANIIRIFRTLSFYLLWTVATLFWALLIIAMIILPYRIRHRISTGWGDTTVWLLRLAGGVKWQVHGLENLPNQPCVLALNHQSTWETVFGPLIRRDQVWVLKRELLWIPFFGWAMALLRPIAINRNNRKQAMQQVIEQGHQRISNGFSVVMFPEGHRFSPDAPLHFKQGAARLAESLSIPIVPIAHNAGQFWPRRGWIHSGTIQVIIGKPLYVPQGKVAEVNTTIEAWVRETRDKIVAQENQQRQLPTT